MTKKLIALSLVASLALANEVELDKIEVVSSNSTTQKIKEVTSNIDVITANEIETLHYNSLDELLKDTVGISSTRNGGLGQSTSIYLRGMSGKNIVILIDGVKVNDPTGLSGASIEHIDLDNIKRVEILRGASSSIWGADASAGVINIITKDAKDGVHYGTKLSYGSRNTTNASANISYKNNKFSAIISGAYLKSDGVSSQVSELSKLEEYEKDGYENKNYQAKLGYSITDTNKILLSHKVIFANGDYDKYQTPDDDKSTFSSTQKFSKFNFNHIDSFNKLNLYLNHTKIARVYNSPDYTGTLKQTKYDGQIIQSGLNSKIPYLDNSFLLWGGDYKIYSHDNDLDKSYNSYGGFITNNNILNDNSTIINESLRYENNSVFNSNTTYKAGVKQFFGDFYLSLNSSTGYNAPTLYQLYNPTYGSIDTTPETTTSYDASLGFGGFGVSYFNNSITNLISFDSLTYKTKNIEGTSIIKGVELFYKDNIKLIKTKIDTNYTYLDAKDKDGKILARRPQQKAHVGILFYGINTLDIKFMADYTGSTTDTKYNLDYTTSDVEIGNYTLYSVVLNYKINKDIKLFIRGKNLSDEIYQSIYGYSGTRRSYFAGLNAKF